MIYIVEDDDATRDSLALLLECEGLPCRSFASCEAFLGANPPLEGACLVLDVHMLGMTGLELLSQLRRRAQTVPAIIITGQISPAILQQAAAARAVTVIEKPFDGAVLIALLRSHLPPSAP
ncbi:MAG TPA: response regulator [Stellaceae bacterium]|nr:response regulator [Stellaceae bacterium]